ncbi:MAG: hypothetical protein J5830_04565 [Clostridia bacterium]|nr:hypothetical protein [Clostridia bacterium]
MPAKRENNMMTPSVDELSKIDADKGVKYNRYALAIAVAKSARIAADEARAIGDPMDPCINPIRVGVDRLSSKEYNIAVDFREEESND